MPEPDFSRLFISKLNRIGVNYFITGSIASILYGEPRLTHDIDLVISLSHRDIEKFIKAFPEDEYYCPPEDILRKLEFYREGGSDKHLRDISGMLANSSDMIDFSFLSDQMKTLGLEQEWERAGGFSTP